LKPADLNKPETSENQKTQEHQNNRNPRTDVFEPRTWDEFHTLETIQPFRVNRTKSIRIYETKPRGHRCTHPYSDQVQEYQIIKTNNTKTVQTKGDRSHHTKTPTTTTNQKKLQKEKHPDLQSKTKTEH
jgi:hypothetical protein